MDMVLDMAMSWLVVCIFLLTLFVLGGACYGLAWVWEWAEERQMAADTRKRRREKRRVARDKQMVDLYTWVRGR